mgnify:FL=1|jgi:hypothetical protein|tara:strand:+ start:650 stop:823 length:174 start_codon:yes stop_codon:yes gene_type:complete
MPLEKEHLMFERVKACAQAMDRGISNWSQEFWCDVMGKVISNYQKEITAEQEKKINQ